MVPPAPVADLSSLLETRKVILCVGCGGVGKTTTTAALGLAAARRGKRVLCLTIDPARRLSQSLGLEAMTTEAQVIPQELFRRGGVEVKGTLTVMRLDTKTTFDELVRQLAPTQAQRDRILGNVLYKYISTSLAGTQEYMAMEKVHAVKQDPAYDLVLLDTPPTANALDFLDAPERLVGAIDSPAMRWFIEACESSGVLSLNLVARSAAAVLRNLGKLTGSGFMEQIAELVVELNSLFGGWRKRADAVSADLRGPDVAYVLVTTPEPLSVREVLYFAERLDAQGMPRDAFVVNRVHESRGADASPAALEEAMRGAGVEPNVMLVEGVLAAARDESLLGRAEAQTLRQLDARLPIGKAGPSVRVTVPAYPEEVHDIRGLAVIADLLVS